MTENMSNFMKVVKKDKDLMNRLGMINSPKALIKFAKENGCKITMEDLVQNSRKIDDNEMEKVMGGCGIVPAGEGIMPENLDEKKIMEDVLKLFV